jgi:hypothetical protein
MWKIQIAPPKWRQETWTTSESMEYLPSCFHCIFWFLFFGTKKMNVIKPIPAILPFLGKDPHWNLFTPQRFPAKQHFHQQCNISS